MFCAKCGTPNSDGSVVCVNCGAPLQQSQTPDGGYAQQPSYQQPAYPQQNYPQPYQQSYQQPAPYGQPAYNYGQPVVQPVTGKPTVLYIISGVMAALQFLLVFLPHMTSQYGGYYNFFTIDVSLLKLSSYTYRGLSGFASFLLFMFIVPMALQIVWAVMSFIQRRPAGIFGVIASSIYTVSSLIWLIVVSIAGSSIYTFGAGSMTAVPTFMLLLGIAGIPVSIVQIVKKKYL